MWKRYGQHFLSDQIVLEQIVARVFSLQEETAATRLIEVWPGKGALTRELVMGFDQVELYEVDTRLRSTLEQIRRESDHIQLIWGDVLEQDVQVDSETLVVGNLPYYITSPILRKFFADAWPAGGVFLVQKELAEKLHTQATKKSYLWRLLNLCYEITLAVDVAPTAFSPPPKVDSSLIVLSQKPQPALEWETTIARMFAFLDLVSGLKRKTLGKIAKMRADQLAELCIDMPIRVTSKRLEELERAEMQEICVLSA